MKPSQPSWSMLVTFALRTLPDLLLVAKEVAPAVHACLKKFPRVFNPLSASALCISNGSFMLRVSWWSVSRSTQSSCTGGWYASEMPSSQASKPTLAKTNKSTPHCSSELFRAAAGGDIWRRNPSGISMACISSSESMVTSSSRRTAARLDLLFHRLVCSNGQESHSLPFSTP